MSPEAIIAAVAAVTEIPVSSITGRRRNRRVVYARFLAVAAVRKVHGWWTLESTGDLFHRDHGSIIWAVKRHADLLSTEPHYAALWAQVLEDITPLTIVA